MGFQTLVFPKPTLNNNAPWTNSLNPYVLQPVLGKSSQEVLENPRMLMQDELFLRQILYTDEYSIFQ